MPIYSIDLTHYLGDTGLVKPKRGPARKMAEFLTAVVAHASDFDRPKDIPGPVCFRSGPGIGERRRPLLVERAPLRKRTHAFAPGHVASPLELSLHHGLDRVGPQAVQGPNLLKAHVVAQRHLNDLANRFR